MARDPVNAYCARFGEISVAMGFISPERLDEALAEQREDSFRGRPHRTLGAILFQRGWMTSGQVDTVLKELFNGRP